VKLSKQILFIFFIVGISWHASSQSIGDYRSRASGNWSEASHWDIYKWGLLGNYWTTASSPPNDNTITITIRNGHSITLNQAASCMSINIQGTLNGSTQSLSVFGDWTKTGTFTCETGTVTFSGSDYQYINGSTTFYNLAINNSYYTDYVGLNANISVNGDLTLNQGRLYAVGYTITINGNWISNSTFPAFMAGTGKVIFTGSNKSIQGTFNTLFYNLEINSADSITVDVDNNQIGGTLTLANGGLKLNNNTLIINNPLPGAIARDGVSQLGYIESENENSKLKWNIGIGSGNFVFPFGRYNSGLRFIPLSIDITLIGSGTSGSITAATYHTVNNNTPYPSTVTILNANGSDNSLNVLDRFWMITSASYTSNPTATITFNYEYVNSSDNEFYTPNTIAESTLVAQSWNGIGWNSPVGYVNTTNHNVQVAGTNTFSPWVLVSSASTLPVEFLNFNATCDKSKIRIEWVTASETNNDYFTIERSSDAINFQSVGTVQGAGTSNSMVEYTFFDNSTNNDLLTFYRIKQTDFNGDFSYSSITKIKCENLDNNDFFFYAGSSTNEIMCEIFLNDSGYRVLEILNEQGQVLIQRKMELSKGKNIFPLNFIELSNGIYFISCKDQMGSVIVRKILISH